MNHDTLQSLIASFRAHKQYARESLKKEELLSYTTSKEACLKDLFALLDIFSSLQIDTRLHAIRIDLVSVVDTIKSNDFFDRNDIDSISEKLDALYIGVRSEIYQQYDVLKKRHDTAIAKVSECMSLPVIMFSPQHSFILLKQQIYKKRSKQELSAIVECITSVVVSQKLYEKKFRDSEYRGLYDLLIYIKRIINDKLAMDAAMKSKKPVPSPQKKEQGISQLFDKLPDNFIEAGYFKAQKLLEGGQYLAALKMFEALLEEYPNNSRAPYIHEGIAKINNFMKKPKSSSVAKPSVQENIGYVSPISSTKKINPLTGREENEFA